MATKATQNERDEVRALMGGTFKGDEERAVFLEAIHGRTIRHVERQWSSGELLAQGVTRAQYEAHIEDLEADFKSDMIALNLWRFLNQPR